MVSGLTRAFLKVGSTLPSMLRKGVKEVAKEYITDKVVTTGTNIIHGSANNFMSKVVKDIDQSVKDIENAPRDMMNEFKRQSYHEQTRQAFNNNYDYFNAYHNANATRYTPTPVPNLAEQFYNLEKRDRYIREQYLKNTNIY
ncbi:hypothetical protein VOH95_002949 [Clostridium perfringens]|uniref:hypothetical protein n=1 Tax=Clostridium perfringens TaxID=1502 RepID=UPI0039EB154F